MNFSLGRSELDVLFGENKGIVPGEFWLVSSLNRFESHDVLMALLDQFSYPFIQTSYNASLTPQAFVTDVLGDATGQGPVKLLVLNAGLDDNSVSTETIRELRMELVSRRVATLAYFPLSEEANQLERAEPVMWPYRVHGRGYYALSRKLDQEADGELLVCPDALGANIFRGKHRGNVANCPKTVRINY